MPRRNIILTGFMGTGKSTVGRLLADALGYRFIDTDEWIQDRAGRTVPEIFERDGEAAFRNMEAVVARELATEEKCVIATGGRLMLDPANAAALGSKGSVFCLVATPEEIMARIESAGGVDRPLLSAPDPMERIVALLREREAGYRRFTQIVTSGKTAIDVANEIIDRFKTDLNPLDPDRDPGPGTE